VTIGLRRFNFPRSLAVALLGAAIVSAAPGHCAAQADTLKARIQGVLLDERTGSTVSAGLVRLVTTTGENVVTTESDAQGYFSLQTPGPGEYHLRVERVGYQAKESGSFSLPPGHVMSVQIRLSPAPLPMDSVWVRARRRPLRPGEQLILGRLLDYDSGEPIPQGTVSLLKAYGHGPDDVEKVEEVLSDDDGHFSLLSPVPGEYRIRGDRIGYLPSESSNLLLMPGDSVAFDLYMSMEAIVLDPITVRASARPWGNRYSLLGMEPFFQRLSRFGRSGMGGFLTRDSIAPYEGRMDTPRMLMASITEVRSLDSEGVILRGGSIPGGCLPTYYLNGAQVWIGSPAHQSMTGPTGPPPGQGPNPGGQYAPEDLEGVEVYVFPSIPAELNRGYPCGVVSLWTRRDPGPARAGYPWRRILFVGGVLITALILSF
jgi:hypothetical protein